MSETKYPKYRWFVLIAIFLTAVFTLGSTMGLSPLMGEVAKTLNLDLGATTGLVMLPALVAVVIGAIITGILMDKIGVAKVVFISTLGTFVAVLLTPVLAISVGGMLIFRLLTGLFAAACTACGALVAAEWFPASERVIVTGVQGMGFSVGTAFGFAVTPQIFAITHYWATATAWMSVGVAIAAVLMGIFMFGPKAPEINDIENCDASRISRDFKLALKTSSIWIAFLIAFVVAWAAQGYNDLTPAHIAVAPPVGLGYGPQLSGKMMSIYMIAYMVSSLAVGFIVKALGGRYKIVIFGSFLISAIFEVMVLFPVVHSSTTGLTISIIFMGLFFGMPNPVAFAFIANNFPKHIVGKLGSFVFGLSIIGGLLGVVAGSTALHITGRYNVSIIIVGIVLVFGAVFGLLLNPPKYFCVTDEK
jgi:MFS family permease